MSWRMLLALVTVTWLLWVVAAVVEVWAETRAGRRPPNAGVSWVPVIPLFPLFFFGLAVVINRFAWPWGTRLIGGFHMVLSAVFAVGIVIAVFRGSRSGPAA